MGRKNIINQYTLLDGVDGSSNHTSESTDCSQIDKITYDLTVTNDLVGSVEIEYCNDTRITDASTWEPLDFGEALGVSATTDEHYKFDLDVSFRHTRVAWTNASGTGDLTLKVFGTTIGA